MEARAQIQEVLIKTEEEMSYSLVVYGSDYANISTSQDFPTADAALLAAHDSIAGGALRLHVVHTPSGSALHTWQSGSWSYGKGRGKARGEVR